MLAEFWRKTFWIFEAWQIIPAILLIVLLIFWKIYRNKQT